MSTQYFTEEIASVATTETFTAFRMLASFRQNLDQKSGPRNSYIVNEYIGYFYKSEGGKWFGPFNSSTYAIRHMSKHGISHTDSKIVFGTAMVQDHTGEIVAFLTNCVNEVKIVGIMEEKVELITQHNIQPDAVGVEPAPPPLQMIPKGQLASRHAMYKAISMVGENALGILGSIKKWFMKNQESKNTNDQNISTPIS